MFLDQSLARASWLFSQCVISVQLPATMPVQLLLLLVFSVPPIAGQNNTLSLPEVIQLFQLDTMHELRQTIHDQESIISEQQAKIAKLEVKNARVDETIDFLAAEYSKLMDEFVDKFSKEADESCDAEKFHLREEFGLEILTMEKQCEEEREHRQELERVRSELQKCESTVLYMGNLMVQSSQQNLVEAESENIKEAKEEINRQQLNESSIDIKQLYTDVMNDMKVKFQNGDLNQDQKIAATGVITETQAVLGQKSFEVLGLQIGDMTSVQIFEVLKGWKEAGNMTSQQNSAMEDLAEHSQVRMIQGLLGVFGYTPEQAAQSYKWSAEDLRLFLQLPTFGSDLDYSEFEIDIDYSEPDIDYTDWVWDRNMD